MNDKEFEKLKRKVAEEEHRRIMLAQQKEYLESLKNASGLKRPDGWCRNMKIKIIQDVDVSMSVDGNGSYRHEHNEKELTENECELLFEAFKQMASLCEKNIKFLEYEDKDNAKS